MAYANVFLPLHETLLEHLNKMYIFTSKVRKT